MEKCKCKFYEVDLEAKRKYQAWWNSLPQETKEFEQAYLDKNAKENSESKLSKCGKFCVHNCVGGQFGEYINYCSAKGEILKREFIINSFIKLTV